MSMTHLSQAVEGLMPFKSPYSAQQTMDRFEALAVEKGHHIFARINHSAGAERIGQALRPTEVLLFGHPKGGTPLMQCAQTLGIDLPLKVLVWQDEQGQVWLGYNDPVYLAQRHAVSDCPAVMPLAQALHALTQQVIAD